MGCDIREIKAEELERLVLSVLIEDIFTKSFIDRLSKDYKEYRERINADGDKELHALKAQKVANENHMNKILGLYLDETISKEQFVERTAKYKHSIDVMMQDLKKSLKTL